MKFRISKAVEINLSEEQEKDFWLQVTKTETCWLWNSNKSVKINDAHYLPYRVSYCIHNGGKAPEDQYIVRTCRNKKCVNPEHLLASKHPHNYGASSEQRFFRFIQKDEVSGCWNWQGTKSRGYGMFHFEGKQCYAHRVSYQLFVDTDLKGLDILHVCDNPSCVNPDHLRLGTHQDNMQDMIEKGRQHILAGENHPVSKINWEIVREIRATYVPGKVSYKSLAQKYGIHLSTVALVVNRKIWQE